MKNTLAIANRKGGVGKTTTAVNMAETLALMKKKVLLVDLDGQSSASYSLGVKDLSPSMVDILVGEITAREAIRTTIFGIDLITCEEKLANVEAAMVREKGRLSKLKSVINPIRRNYDFVIFDCPPGLSIMTVNALVASDACIIPVTPHYLALRGVMRMNKAIEQVKTRLKTEVELLGVLLTMVDYRNRAVHEVVDIIRGHFKKQVFDTEIRINTRLAEAPAHGKPITNYEPISTGAQSYGMFTEEFLKRWKKLNTGK